MRNMRNWKQFKAKNYQIKTNKNFLLLRKTIQDFQPDHVHPQK